MIQTDVEVGQCIHCRWLDSGTFAHGWVYGNSKRAEPKEIETVGFIVDLTERGIMLSATRSTSGGYVDPIIIPLISIESHRIIEV